MSDKGRPEPRRTVRRSSESAPLPLVSGAWLLRWLVIALASAAFCGYLTICLLFYQGQWQILFHPSRTLTTTPATLGLPFDDVRFNYTETGLAQLDGWWIPASDTGQPPQTILFLHGASGSLSDVAAQLSDLHSLRVNVFAIDYRGFGLSVNTHPSEEHVYADADAALAYLTQVRHIAPHSLVLYGVGMGATVAVETARRHQEISGLILEDPALPALTLIERDPRTKLLPLRLLFRDRFELAPRLQSLKTPKLFLQRAPTDRDYFPAAAAPKTLFSVPAQTQPAPSLFLEAIQKFLASLSQNSAAD